MAPKPVADEKTTPSTQHRDPETGGLTRADRCPHDCVAGRLYNLRRAPQKTRPVGVAFHLTTPDLALARRA
eukprot:11171114-Lingulodinium_polyedra.AAC.1